MTVILGLDPGLTRTGLAVLEVNKNRELKLLEAELIETKPEDSQGERLLKIAEEIARLFSAHSPTLAAFERPFLTEHNKNTGFGTVQVVGLLQMSAAKANINCVAFTPAEVKSAVSGSGTASKAQVKSAVSKLLRLPQSEIDSLSPKADLWDAVAVAITAALKPAVSSRHSAPPSGQNLTDAQKLWMSAAKRQVRSGERQV